MQAVKEVIQILVSVVVVEVVLEQLVAMLAQAVELAA
jgi:hypothetical protein